MKRPSRGEAPPPMKFYCDACNTKYAISDEKVRGKVLKVRCKNCGNIITVREAVAPLAGDKHGQTDPTISTPTHIPSPQDLAVPTTNWYYALNGQTFGPFTLDGLRRKYATAEIGDATYVWHERLGSWKPVANEPAFADALAVGHKIVPSRKTLGFTGPVEAIRVVHGGPSTQREGAVPDAAHHSNQQVANAASPQPKLEPKPKPQPKLEPKPQPQPKLEPKPQPQPQPQPKPKSKPKPKPKQSRPVLPKSAAPAKPAPSVPKKERPILPPKKIDPKPAPSPETPRRATPQPAPTPEARPIKDVRKSSLDRLRAKLDDQYAPDDADEAESLPKPVGGEAIFTYASGIIPASSASSQDMRSAAADDAVDFNLPPRAKPSKLSPSSTSDILDAVIGPTDEPPQELSEASEVDDSGVIPFFTETPQLPSQIEGATGQEATAESVSIDIDQMHRSRRKGLAAIGIGAVVIIALLVTGGVMVLMQDPEPTVTPPADDAVGQQQEHKDDLEIRTYGKDELGELATMNLEEELLFDEDDVDPVEGEEEEVAEGATGAASSAKSAKTGGDGAEAKRPKPVTKVKKPTNESGPSIAKAEAAEEPAEKVDPLTALLQPRAHKSTEIKAPEDKLLAQRREGLTKDQARRGFRKIRESIAQCRERHNRYNAALGVGKLKISVTVDPAGEVSRFTLAPRKVENTEFHNCMKSHRTRWRFAAFNGKPVVINTSVIIQ